MLLSPRTGQASRPNPSTLRGVGFRQPSVQPILIASANPKLEFWTVVDFPLGVPPACYFLTSDTEGLVVSSFDMVYADSHNLRTDIGFRRWMLNLLCSSRASMQWLAPQCSSWIWMSRSVNKRSSDLKC